MRTRIRHLPDITTAAAVLAAKKDTWAQTAVALGFAANMGATLWLVAQRRPSAVTEAGEELLRAALGLFPLSAPMPTSPCPTCLAAGIRVVHAAGDCHGRPVAQVVCLGPDEATTTICPSCGGVHVAGDCSNQPVAAVICLAPGQVVAPVKIKRPPRPQSATLPVRPATRELARATKGAAETWDAWVLRATRAFEDIARATAPTKETL